MVWLQPAGHAMVAVLAVSSSRLILLSSTVFAVFSLTSGTSAYSLLSVLCFMGVSEFLGCAILCVVVTACEWAVRGSALSENTVAMLLLPLLPHVSPSPRPFLFLPPVEVLAGWWALLTLSCEPWMSKTTESLHQILSALCSCIE